MSTTATPAERQRRELTSFERRVRVWIAQNNGVLSRVARELGLSVAFVQRIAYQREARSQGLRVENKLWALGCPRPRS